MSIARILPSRTWLVVLVTFAGCQQAPPRAPTPADTWPAGVAAANPYAVEAGLEILSAGGSAVDAAVAVQSMLGLVEPQSSGLGGGAFLLYYDAATGTVSAFDGREAAPAAASPEMFLDAGGEPLGYAAAVTSGKATGVPGVVAMLGAAHERYGQLPWRALFAPAIRLARDGFRVPGRLARFAATDFAPQPSLPDVKALFSRPDGAAVQKGDLLRNPAYAETLRRVAARGPRALLEGELAAQIVARTHDEPLPGGLTLEDMNDYQPRVVDPLCEPFLAYRICVPPPPSSGVSLLQMLGIMERAGIAKYGPQDPEAWFLFAEAARLMYADRDRYVADPAFVDVPVEALLEPRYLAQRAQLIGDRAGPAPSAGALPGYERSPDATREAPGTSHFVVIDADGNVVSMTTSVESLFGSGRAVGGFVLNNQLTDFSFVPMEDGHPVANAVAGGKRPRSSMSPVLVLDDEGDLVAALGSPGGSAILVYNAKALVGLLAWDLPLQEAIELPNLYARGESFHGEVDKFTPGIVAALDSRGVILRPGRGEESGLHGLTIEPDREISGAADPRREGSWQACGEACAHAEREEVRGGQRRSSVPVTDGTPVLTADPRRLTAPGP